MLSTTCPQRLRVTPAGLNRLAGRCESLSGELAIAAAPAVTVSTWQANAGAVNTSNARVRTAAATLGGRMQATAVKLTEAASCYVRQDVESAAKFRELGDRGAR